MFLLSQNDENQSENGSKNSKIRLRARPPAEPQKKDVANQKIEVKKLKNTGFFTFRLPISRTGVFRTVFYSVFWRRASRPIKNRRFWPKNAPPPGKPVTFYECHPEDHAPAPSVRADFSQGAGGRSNPKRRAGRVCRACPNLGESSPSCGMRNHMNHIEMWLVATKKWAHVLMRGTLCAVPDFQSNPQWSIYLRHPDQVFFACSAAHRPIRSVTCGRILVDSSWL